MIPLPPAYTARMHTQLGEDAQAYFEAMEQPYVRGLRVNPHKTPDQSLDTMIEGLQTAVPWEENGRYLDIGSTAGSYPLHGCGAYYMQEPSAMLPARLLNPKPGQTVLDLCAAPGGKSTQIAAMMRGEGTLVCNEIVSSRAAILSGNLERMGVQNALVVSADPRRLSQAWPQFFDSILVDAPCSGEGMFRRHPESRLEWAADTPAQCARRQLLILESAAVMLKAGGRLCYATCTFSKEENEDIISAFLSSHPEFQAVDFTVPIGSGNTLRSQSGCVRLYPHKVSGEGHFAALLIKTNSLVSEAAPAVLLPPKQVFAAPDRKTLDVFRSFWTELSQNEPPAANAMIGNLLVYAPPLPPMDGLKAYRAGLSLGRLKGKTFIPDHALALAVPPPPLRAITLDDEQMQQYLYGEVLQAGKIESGFWTVSCFGLPLGFVKHSDGQLKNHYPKGLRRFLG